MTFYKIDLQFFGDVSGDGAGSSGSQADSQAAAGSVVTEQAQDTAAGTDTEDFESLIGKNGKYKAEYDKHVQQIVDKRFKETKKTESRLSKAEAILQTVATRYNLDLSDLDAVDNAVKGDDYYYEDKAAEAGLSTPQYRNMVQIQAENDRLKAERDHQERMQRAQEQYDQWRQEEKVIKSEFPEFNLDNAIRNENFQRLMRSGVDLKTAYIACNADGILSGAMAYTAKEVAKKTAGDIAARGARPMENGLSGQAAAKSGVDVSKLSNEEIADYVDRAAHGERITFS